MRRAPPTFASRASCIDFIWADLAAARLRTRSCALEKVANATKHLLVHSYEAKVSCTALDHLTIEVGEARLVVMEAGTATQRLKAESPARRARDGPILRMAGPDLTARVRVSLPDVVQRKLYRSSPLITDYFTPN